MTNETDMRKVLVVLGPEMANPDEPLQSRVMQRAVALAGQANCELELLYVCYDSALENNVFVRGKDLERMREQQIEKDATRLAEIAAWLGNEGVRVRHEVRWDTPRTDAILRKIAEAEPDLVIKEAGEHGYVLGITSNTDWDLARRSPAHVWFVNEKVDGIRRIAAAVGDRAIGAEDPRKSPEYDLLRTARKIGEWFDAGIYPVNAYRMPHVPAMVGAVRGAMVPAQPSKMYEKAHAKIVTRHFDTVNALAKSLDIPHENVYVREGDPNDVVPEIVESIPADLLVMGASSISRVERILSPVTVEPVMSKVDCDILVLREADDSRLPDAREFTPIGRSKYDLNRAITRPEDAFESPVEVASMSGVSVALRERILQAWEYDIRAEMQEENEGGAVNDIDIEALSQIESAREFLEVEKAQDKA